MRWVAVAGVVTAAGAGFGMDILLLRTGGGRCPRARRPFDSLRSLTNRSLKVRHGHAATILSRALPIDGEPETARFPSRLQSGPSLRVPGDRAEPEAECAALVGV